MSLEGLGNKKILEQTFTATKIILEQLIMTTGKLRQKLDPVSKKAILVGYEPGSKAFRILMEDTKKIVISRDVTFDEDTKGQRCAAKGPRHMSSIQ